MLLRCAFGQRTGGQRWQGMAALPHALSTPSAPFIHTPASLSAAAALPRSLPLTRHLHSHSNQSNQSNKQQQTSCCAHHKQGHATHSAPVAPSSPTAAFSTSSATPASASSSPPVRVRYAPSPTGSVHLGGLRTALYNYLFARKGIIGGKLSSDPSAPPPPPGRFLLRIEDTDQKRLVPGAVGQLLSVLKWAGIEPDEGPGAPTENNTHGPYVQSERLPIYKKYAEQLLEAGHAYPCFCSAERLTELRDLQTKKGLPSMYDRLCLGMEEEERALKLKECEEQGLPYVIRMKIPHGSTTVKDLIRGLVQFPNKTLDDQVLLKSDGFPTYHFACVVDDHLMKVSHVIRGEEWVTSTPKHVLLYKMFGWQVPLFAHLPLLLKPDGTKLSKRHADSSLDYYIDRGYLPEAVVNFVAMLGWNPGSTQEVFSMEELVDAFSLERIQKAGAVVNLDKLNWFNQQHIQIMVRNQRGKLMGMVRPRLLSFHRQSNEEVAAGKSTSPLVSEEDLADEAYLVRILNSLAAHVTHIQDFVTDSLFYYRMPVYDQADNEKLQELKAKVYPDAAAKEINAKLIAGVIEQLLSLPESAFAMDAPPASTSPGAAAAATPAAPATPTIQDALKTVWKANKIKQKQLFLLLRYILTGSESGPGVTTLIATLGRDRTLQRLRNQSAYTPQ